jgi:hypothetical protein
MIINPEKFQESITKELEVVKDRVRNLIGSANWGEEGRYKEVVLMNVIRRFLPSNLSVGTGFIVKSETGLAIDPQITASKQIDIIVYDNRIPVLFSEGNFVITTGKHVKALIEVKTRAENRDLAEILRVSIEKAKILERIVFNGVFAFEYSNNNLIETLKATLEALGEEGKYVNHISLGPSVFVKHWMRGAPVDSDGCDSDFYGIYDFRSGSNQKRISFSYFISNLLFSMSGTELDDRLWLLFPIKEGKEQYRVGTACLGRRT